MDVVGEASVELADGLKVVGIAGGAISGTGV
jgi:hypothetical protein